MSKFNPLVYQVFNVIAVILTIIVNMLANILPLNGVTTGQVSDSYPNLFTPPGYVFAIWFVIYLQAILFMIYQVRANQRGEAYLGRISFLYLLSGIVNISWIFVFHYSFGVPLLFLFSTILIVVLLIILLLIYLRLGIGVETVPTSQKFGVHLSFSVYLGWISLATIANLASTLNVLIVIPLEIQALWTAAVIIIALLITLLMIYLRRDFAFGLVVIWAAIGIALKQIATPIIFGTALATVAIISLTIILLPFLKKSTFTQFYMVH